MVSGDDLLAANDIDHRWLRQCLVKAGVVDADRHLQSMSARVIGTGQVGENVRCELAWGHDDGGAHGESAPPESVVIKLPSASPISRATAAATRTYIREVGFYRDVRDLVSIRTPLPYFVSEDRADNGFVLVMEDIRPAEQGDQLSGCTPEQATLAVEAIAALHADSWDRADLLDHDWIDQPSGQNLDDRAELYRQLVPGFANRYRGALTTEELELGDWLAEHMPDLLRSQTGPRCLVHGDFRLDNLLFATGPGAPPITTVDWQTVSFGYGLADVAYFMSGAFAGDERRRHEPTLMATYQNAMAERDVVLAEDEMWRGFRLGSSAGYAMAVIASQIVEQTERGDAMFVAMARGAAQLMADHDLPNVDFGA